MKPSKTKTVYVCQSCGSQSPRWMGKCPDCGTAIAGRFTRFDRRAQFGRRRIPVAISR